jgi:hypothetical protein
VLGPLAQAIRTADDATKQKMKDATGGAMKGMQSLVDELSRMKNNVSVDTIKNLVLDEGLFCNGDTSRIVSAITGAGLKPDAGFLSALAPPDKPGKHFFMEVGFSVASAVGLGAQESLSFVTDFGDNTAAFWSYGGGITTNVSAGIFDFVNFYPAASLDDFGGDITDFSSWNWEVALSGGEIAGGGLTLVFDNQMGVHPEDHRYAPWPLGIGFTLGLSADILPVEGSVAATYSFLLAK